MISCSCITVWVLYHKQVYLTCHSYLSQFVLYHRFNSPVTAVSGAVVPAVDAASSVRVAVIGVSVAGAGAAGGEAPVARETAITLPTVRSRNTNTLTGQLIAEQTLWTLRVACTRCKHKKTQKTQNTVCIYCMFMTVGKPENIKISSGATHNIEHGVVSLLLFHLNFHLVLIQIRFTETI